MENASKALMIAAGTLIGIMIIGTLVYFYNSLKGFPEQQNEAELLKQISAFNTEYEAYNKKIMYGTDLISVLNKAKNNNEKYVKGNFLTGFTYDMDYVIDIEFSLKSALEEQITVKYYNNATGQESKYNESYGVDDTSITIKSEFEKNSRFKNDNFQTYLKVSGTNLDINKPLRTNTYTSKTYTNKTFNLVGSGADAETDVNLLLNSAGAMTLVIENSANINNKVSKSSSTNGGWSSAEWKTVLYDLKSRKFACENVNYNTRTGRIDKMVFKER